MSLSKCKRRLSAVILGAAAFTMAGCEVEVEEGPAEEIGEGIDEAVEGDGD